MRGDATWLPAELRGRCEFDFDVDWDAGLRFPEIPYRVAELDAPCDKGFREPWHEYVWGVYEEMIFDACNESVAGLAKEPS